MPVETSDLAIAGLVVQAIAALGAAAVFRGFHRDYPRQALGYWSRSWLALAAAIALQAAGASLLARFAPSHPLRAATAAVGLAAGYLQVVWLLLGTYELATGTAVASRTARRIAWTVALVGGLSALLFVWVPGPSAERAFVRVGLRGLLAGTAFSVAARAVWCVSGRARAQGHRIISGAFAAYGLEQLALAALTGAALARGSSPALATWTGLVEIFLQFALALGLVAWLLEDERRAAAAAARRAEHLAFHDRLTGLPNRALFMDRLRQALAQARRDGRRVAVLFVDLDRFKSVNDSLGHAAGDELLRAFAGRMLAVLRRNDTVARFGGDEFAVLSPDVGGADDAVTIAGKLRLAVEEPVVIEGRELATTASVGIALYPDDGADAESLLRNADLAMYRAKAAGRDGHHLYTAGMHAEAAEELELETALRRALVADELEMHYQPILDLRTGRLEAVEALARWRHPDFGLLPPDAFIPLAERTGLIVQLGEWSLRTACCDVRGWQLAGLEGLRASVNVSVRQLQRPDFAERVAAVLAECDFDPRLLELEITESVALHATDVVLDGLRRVRALGVRLAIDDFGTGYSSLAALRLCPVDSLKIDRSFVHDLTSDGGSRAGLARAVIALAHSMSLVVVAEGVETETQLAALTRYGCDAAQGFLWSRPAPATSWGRALLNSGEWRAIDDGGAGGGEPRRAARAARATA